MIESKDTFYINQIFEQPYDSRITHKRKNYGESVYQARMKVMERISGIKAPKAIEQEPDTVIVSFYELWARKNGYIK